MTYTNDFIALQFDSIHGNRWGVLIRFKVDGVIIKQDTVLEGRLDGIMLDKDAIEWDEDDDVSKVVRGASGNINVCLDGEILDIDAFRYIFVTSDITDRRIEVYRNFVLNSNRTFTGELVFQGFISSDAPNMKYEPYPFMMSVNIKDCVAAMQDIKPKDFINRVISNKGYFNAAKLVEWWCEDTGCVLASVPTFSDYTSSTGRFYASDFIDIDDAYKDNVRRKTVIKPQTYEDIFEKILARQPFCLRGNTLCIDDTPIYGLVKLDSYFTVEDDDHTYEFIETDDEEEVLDAHAQSISLKPNKEDYEIIEYGKTPSDGMGYCMCYFGSGYSSLMTDRSVLDFDFDTGVCSRSTQNNLIEINTSSFTISAYQPVLTLKSKEPVVWDWASCLLKGKIMEYVTENKKTQLKNLYDVELKYSLKWRNLYYDGNEGWKTTQTLLPLKMRKKCDNSDSSQFFDGIRDFYPGKEPGNISHFHGINNEGIHICAPINVDRSAETYGYSGILELNIYVSPSYLYRNGHTQIYIQDIGLNVEAGSSELEWHTPSLLGKRLEKFVIKGCVPKDTTKIDEYHGKIYDIDGTMCKLVAISCRSAYDMYDLTMIKI